jgi:NADH-quinone oxidoreductase subunit L
MTIPLVILAALSVVAGWGTGSYFTTHAEGHAAHAHSVVPMLLAIGAFALGTFAAYSIYNGKTRETVSFPLFRHKFYFDEIYGAIVAGTQDVLAYAAKGIDAVISAAARGLGMLAWAGGFLLRLFQIGNVQAYSFIFGLGVVALIWFLIFR